MDKDSKCKCAEAIRIIIESGRKYGSTAEETLNIIEKVVNIH